MKQAQQRKSAAPAGSRRRYFSLLLGPLLLVALTVPLACGDAPERQSEVVEVPTEAVGAESIQDARIEDARIVAALRQEFEMAKGVSTDPIDVKVEDGIVTLAGTVDNLLAQDRATRIASSVKGVRAVVNNLSVSPSTEPDAEIEGEIEMVLAADPATEAWEIAVSVEGGRATLAGTVESWQERQLAGTVAKGVSGVMSLQNEIAVESAQERSVDEIRADVVNTLKWDARVDDRLINVEVEDGAVTLSGAVGSAYEASVALNDAWVTGVDNVDASALRIEWWARDEMERTEWASERSSDEIEAAVEDAWRQDPRVKPFNVEASVLDGTATLTGVVDNVKAKNAAAEDARNTVGVWYVENNIRVEPSEAISDTILETNVKARLLADPYVEQYEIDVDAEDGVVRLKGKGDSYFELHQSEDVASRIAGVIAVENNLAVEYPSSLDETTFYDWNPITYDVDFQALDLPNLELEGAVENERFWSPFVDSETITVNVEDGVVTLTGTVDDWAERKMAAEEALDAGATAVKNEFIVNYGPEA